MKKFLLLYKNPSSVMSAMNPESITPESMKSVMDLWMAWYGKVGTAVVDGGTPLNSVMQIGKGNASTGDNPVTGYTIVQAEDMDAVRSLLNGHPHLMTSGSNIEVLELMPMSM